MCGYCVEAIILKLIHEAMPERNIEKHLDPTDCTRLSGYLMEWPDLATVLGLMHTSGADIHTDDAIVIVCRGLATLMDQGFDSPAYQDLLAQPVYFKAIDLYTNLAGEDDPLRADPRFDLSTATWIKDKATYVVRGHLDRHLRHWTLDSARGLLRQHVDFRLYGIGLLHNEDDARHIEAMDLDPSDYMNVQDRQIADVRLPAFWCALHWLARQPAGMEDAWEVVKKIPIGLPMFFELSLWVQRQAALLVFDHAGIAPFVRHLASVRAELFQAIAILRPFAKSDRERLLATLDQIDEADMWMLDFSLRKWLESGDLQLEWD